MAFGIVSVALGLFLRKCLGSLVALAIAAWLCFLLATWKSNWVASGKKDVLSMPRGILISAVVTALTNFGAVELWSRVESEKRNAVAGGQFAINLGTSFDRRSTLPGENVADPKWRRAIS